MKKPASMSRVKRDLVKRVKLKVVAEYWRNETMFTFLRRGRFVVVGVDFG